jgi:hypothetical protein
MLPRPSPSARRSAAPRRRWWTPSASSGGVGLAFRRSMTSGIWGDPAVTGNRSVTTAGPEDDVPIIVALSSPAKAGGSAAPPGHRAGRTTSPRWAADRGDRGAGNHRGDGARGNAGRTRWAEAGGLPTAPRRCARFAEAAVGRGVLAGARVDAAWGLLSSESQACASRTPLAGRETCPRSGCFRRCA